MNGYREMNGNGGGWDQGFFRFIRYAAIVGAAVWYFAEQKSVDQTMQGGLDSLRVEVRSVASKQLTREEFVRLMRLTNKEHERLWRAMGRPEMYRENE